jgi:hypothetical protein
MPEPSDATVYLHKVHSDASDGFGLAVESVASDRMAAGAALAQLSTGVNPQRRKGEKGGKVKGWKREPCHLCLTEGDKGGCKTIWIHTQYSLHQTKGSDECFNLI